MFRRRAYRTTIKPVPAFRTKTVRRAPCRSPVIALLLFAGCCAATAGDRRQTSVAQQRTEARGWLQLDQEQRTYRERVEPLQPQEEATLEQLERRQQLDLRGLHLEQRRDRRRQELRSRTHRPDRPPPPASEPGDGRELSRERLDRRIQREILRGGSP